MFQKQPPKVLYEKKIMKNFAKFKEKHLNQSFFFNKIAGLRPATSIQLFSNEFWENFKDTFCIKHNWVAAAECLSSSKYASLSVSRDKISVI